MSASIRLADIFKASFVLGETRMGKTSMLNRIADDLTPDDRPVVRVNAHFFSFGRQAK